MAGSNRRNLRQRTGLDGSGAVAPVQSRSNTPWSGPPLSHSSASLTNGGSLRWGLAEPAGRGSVFARERCILPSTWTETDPTRNAQREKLVETLRGYGRVAVAFSGGSTARSSPRRPMTPWAMRRSP